MPCLFILPKNLFAMPGRLLCWCIIISCCCNCKNSTPYSNCISAKEAHLPLTLSSGDTINLYLDSLMVLGISTPVDYHTNELYVFDNYNNRLLKYPLSDTNDIIHPENIQKINVKNKITYLKYLSADSLMLYSYSGAALFCYSTTSHQITQTLPFRNRSAGRYAAPPYANAASPLLFNDHTIIGFGFLIGENNQENPVARTIATVIQPDGNIRYLLPYSRVYHKHNWGGSHMRTPYTAWNEEKKQILLSLPADHNMQIIDSNWQVREIPAATRKNICINSMDISKDNEKVSDAEYTLEYFSGTPSYRNIIYDHYHQRYYRILELPATADTDKEASLIAFDKDFKYLGEAALPKALALDNFFISADGIYFLNTNNKNQNIARYVQYKMDL